MNGYPLILCFFLLFVQSVKAQDFPVKHLFYCNTFQNIEELWIVNPETALGKRMESTEGQYSHHVKDMVLINHKGLIVDSASFKNILGVRTGFVQLQNFWRTGKHTFFVEAGGIGFDISIQGERLSVQRHLHNGLKRKELAHPKGYTEFRKEHIVTFETTAIGYQREKFRKGGISSKKDFQNHPIFWVAELHENSFIQPRLVNPDPEQVTDDIFYDWRDWDIVTDRTNIFSFANYVKLIGKQFYFSVPRSNTCYTYHTETKSITGFKFPPIEKGESFMHFYDYLEKIHYAVKKTKKAGYHLFRITEGFKTVQQIAIMDRAPEAIVGGQLHFRVEEKEGKRAYKCHYLVPIDTMNTKMETQVLQEVEIE